MPYVMASLISIWNGETTTGKKNIFFKMKQTIFLEFDIKDASESASRHKLMLYGIGKTM